MAVLRNTGTVAKTAGTGDTFVDWAIDNRGVKTAYTGHLVFRGPTAPPTGSTAAMAPGEQLGAGVNDSLLRTPRRIEAAHGRWRTHRRLSAARRPGLARMTNNSTTSLRSLPYWWRVTRYDPARRDARGVFPAGDWTSIADVGAVFEGVELNSHEYERVETAYADSFGAFAEDSGVTELEVRSLECGDGLREGQILSLLDARAVVRRMLREEARCRLEAPTNTFAVHIGFDLYMYIGSTRPSHEAQRRTRLLGLFAEPGQPSPLWQEDDS
jgi:hypothetical protein